jgi:ribosome recycling factor
MAEEVRVRVRSARREGIDAVKKLQKDGEISEDELKNYEEEIQKLTDAATRKIEETLAAKEGDIMKV